MSRRIGLRLLGVLLVVLVGFGAWWVTHSVVGSASGFHVVDGFWLGPESTCTDANAPDYCAAAIQTATEILEAQRPDVNIVRAAIAPPSCNATTYVVCTTAGLGRAFFVVFDLGDGSRLPVGVECQGTLTQGSEVVSTPACLLDVLNNYEAGAP
jgi:hypothetical protein